MVLGLDFGLTPACIFGQKDARGRWFIIDELVADDMGVQRFGEVLGKYIDDKYGHFPNSRIRAFGDPAGNQRLQTDEQTCMAMIRKAANIDCRAAPSNDWTLRRESVAGALNRMVDGKPGFQLSQRCRMLRKGFSGGFHYKRVKVTGWSASTTSPIKMNFAPPRCPAIPHVRRG